MVDTDTQIQVYNHHHGTKIEKKCNKKYLVNALGSSQLSTSKKSIEEIQKAALALQFGKENGRGTAKI